MRQFGNIRFAQMILFIAITAALLAGLFQENSTISYVARTTLKVGGVLLTIIFWVLDQRAIVYWRYFRKRAIELEKILEFKQHTFSPAENIFSATNAIRLLYFSILAFWVISLLFHSSY
jgi:hypothetical protein